MQIKLIESAEIAPDVRHFVFEAPEVETFTFVPGQFVSINHVVNEKKITRAYSIASAPSESNRFELCLDLVQDGLLSPRLFALQPGEALEIRPPLGMFVLRNPPRDSVLIATGTGIAPFRSMLQAQLNESSQKFTLVFGARHEGDLLYSRELEGMAAKYSHFQFLPTLSRPGESWKGRSGYVQEHLKEAIGERRDVDVFLCGMKAMVDDVRNILKEMGFDRKQIFYEKYD
ncbi:MAG TPA: FAD-binding oxidoreductase [Bryobacteraceae bacterium]|nr:FAD-binding oxidoreductase [Bryobacteraceae bacterium]